MATIKILLVDDDDIVLSSLSELLRYEGFEVTEASSALEALRLIHSSFYDVLLTDLHMPGAGDGLTVIGAMRHANPKTVTILLSSFPEMEVAALAIMSQTDEILVKPMEISALVKAITRTLSQGSSTTPPVETVATILERSTEECIGEWFEQVQLDGKLLKVNLTREERCRHLPKVFSDLIERLRANQPLGAKGAASPAAGTHGVNRRQEGYSASMLVEESRILQVSIFHTLQKNLATIDFSVLLYQVMTIADEVDSQLRQAMECYAGEAAIDGQPA
jgi:YesN/AraC family two-component response regulator